MTALVGAGEWLFDRAWRLPSLVTLIVLLPILVLGESSDAAARDRLAASLAQDAMALTRRGAVVVDTRLAEMQRLTERTAHDPAVRGALATHDEAAAARAADAVLLGAAQITGTNIVSPNPSVVAWCVDENGNAIGIGAGTGSEVLTDSTTGTTKLIGRPGSAVSDRPSFLSAKATASTSEPRTSMSLEQNVFLSQPVVSLVSPVQGGLKPFIGAVVLETPTLDLGRVVESQVNAGQDLYVVIASSARLVTRATQPRQSGVDVSAHTALLTSGGVSLSDPIAGGRRIAASVPVGDTGWRIIGVLDPTSAEDALDAVLGTGRTVRLGLAAILLAAAVMLGRSAASTVRQQRQLRESLDRNVELLDQVEHTSRDLESANRHKSEFLANMSHELRTPLNAILGFGDVLRQRMVGELNPKQAEYLDDIHVSARHLLTLINDILDLSKVEAGKMDLELSTFSLPEALANGMTMVRERAAGHGIRLGLQVGPGVDAIVADERKVRQLFLNLLSNAVKFTPDGGSVTVDASKEDAEVHVAVKDTGVGIAPEDQSRIFDEFEQAKSGSGRAGEGTGLGLALAKRFVELHGGRIWVDSALGAGSTFTVALPLVASWTRAVPESAADPGQAGAESPSA